MISVKSVSKIYNRRKKNQKIVLNNVSLDLPNKGMVMILGESGSGKTTLMNIIAGLDQPTSGTVVHETKTLTTHDWDEFDRFRNENIGYVFQNFNLLDDMTVFENVAIALEMVGLKDKQLIRQQVEAVLSALGMIRFKERKCTELSGGQQQRVAIARAIVKNPQIIIADEPTGNLDYKTSIEIMDILSAIAKNRLVLMVTHEHKLAKDYADHIIQIIDGKISEKDSNDLSLELAVKDDRVLYLSDFQHKEAIDTSLGRLELYSTNQETMNFKLLLKNRVLYVYHDDQSLHRVQYINQQTDIALYSSPQEEERLSQRNSSIDMDWMDQLAFTSSNRSNKHAITTRRSLEKALVSFFKPKWIQYGLYVLYLLGGVLLGVISTLFLSALKIDYTKYYTLPMQTIEVHSRSQFSLSYAQLIGHSSIDQVAIGSTTTYVQFELGDLYQSMGAVNQEVTLLPMEWLKHQTILAGTMTDASFVLTKSIAERLLENPVIRASGRTKIDDLLGIRIVIPLYERITGKPYTLPVTAIVADNYPIVYMPKSVFHLLSSPSVTSLDLFQDDLLLTAGRMPAEATEILMPQSQATSQPFSPYTESLGGVQYTVVGLFEIEIRGTAYDLSRPLIRAVDYDSCSLSLWKSQQDFRKVLILSNNNYNTKQFLTGKNISYTMQMDVVNDSIRPIVSGAMLAVAVVSAVVILLIGLGFYFTIRSSMFSRIKEIAIYRSMGAKRSDISRLIRMESILCITGTTGVGFLLGLMIAKELRGVIGEYLTISVNTLNFLFGFFLLYVLLLRFSIGPVRRLNKKTPAEILSKYDI